jgi:hypothetical protein
MKSHGGVTLSQVVRAFQEIGGEATKAQIIDQVTKIRDGDYSHYSYRDSYEKTTYQIIQQHCPGYKKYVGPARFEKIGRTGVFRLIGNESAAGLVKSESKPVMPQATPIATDIQEPSQPERVKQETYRILRDTVLARQVKESNKYRCHICGQTLKLRHEQPYAEAHHIKPLGSPHDGPDVRENILCVCPNHHVLLDYGAIKLDAKQLTGIGGKYIDYHNENIFGKRGDK